MSFVESRVRVRYGETDQMGIVYHANYLVWMEVARVEYCRASGISYAEMEKEGILLAVVEANCRYISSAFFDDEVLVRASIAEAHPRLLRFTYEMVNAATGRRLATGETKHVFCSPDHRPMKLPEKYRAAFKMKKPESRSQGPECY